MSFPQLSGHANSIQLTADGTLLIKQTLLLEHEFYTMMEQARAMGARFVSKFYGVLTESNVGVEALNGIEGEVPKTSTGDTNAKQFLVLSNLINSFKKPNVLDLKLGTVLYDELDQACSEDKKARMIKTARETTTGECGLRLTAFQVNTNLLMPVTTPKIYGKSLKKEQLPEGIRRVFPVLGEPIPISVPGAASPSLDLGLPPSILLPILRAIHNSLTHLHSILKDIEIRIIGGSLLVVWEGDQERAQEGVNWMKERERMIRERIKRDFGDDNDEEYYSDDDDDDEDTAASQSLPSEPLPNREKPKRKPSAPYKIALIDFAHTRFVPGQGSDSGVLLGLETFAELIEDRIKEVEESERGRTEEPG
ncbi:hypothetical protein F5050DRAFT_1578515 [Lentinula boryana]|uniref:Kinase n=1 Tax=Lentinula boryana TaxID=40481 RepID=A0ABQ8Q3N4_9AGAR|nr:hypothetical protein F5050DRAFT_1578515 [Lentinula boryana]